MCRVPICYPAAFLQWSFLSKSVGLDAQGTFMYMVGDFENCLGELFKMPSSEAMERARLKARERYAGMSEEDRALQKERSRTYYLANKDKINARGKAYRRANPDKCRAWNRDWKRRYPKKQRASEKASLRKSPERFGRYKIAKNMQQRFRLAFTPGARIGIIRGTLGYTAAELRAHIEVQFRDGMTWENRGRHGWHIDHKIPLCRFRYLKIDEPEFLAAWALSNLQPLWWWENEAKGTS